jgi:hypothetical protein
MPGSSRWSVRCTKWLRLTVVLQETLRQQDWKIERLTKDNRALEAANMELRARLDELRDENLQVGGLPGLLLLTGVCSLVVYVGMAFMAKDRTCCSTGSVTAG